MFYNQAKRIFLLISVNFQNNLDMFPSYFFTYFFFVSVNYLELSQCTVTKVKDIIRCVEEHYLNPDWWVIHSAGLTCDATGLPEHITTEVELLEAFQQFKEFLKALKTPPILITLARSTEDDYCPPEQVDFIQNSVLDIVKSIFGEISIELCYKKK